MSRVAAAPMRTAAFSTEHRAIDRFKEYSSWREAFDQVRRFFDIRDRRLLYLFERSKVGTTIYHQTSLASLDQISELEAFYQTEHAAAKFVVVDVKTQEFEGEEKKFSFYAVVLIYMKGDESFTVDDVSKLQF